MLWLPVSRLGGLVLYCSCHSPMYVYAHACITVLLAALQLLCMNAEVPLLLAPECCFLYPPGDWLLLQ